jgi:hypothetical protein
MADYPDDGITISDSEFSGNIANISSVVRAINWIPFLNKNVIMKDNKALLYGGEIYTFPSGLMLSLRNRVYKP